MTTRTPTSRGAATRARIVDAAAALFHERGVGATGLDDVLSASGTGKSQVYHYFGGKAGLVDDVIDTQATRIVGWHAGQLADVHDVAGLRRWAATVVEAVGARGGAYGCPLGSLGAELADTSEAHRERVARGFAGWEQVLADAVRRVVDDPEVAARAAAVLLTALQGGLLLADTLRDTRHLQIALAAAVADIADVAVRAPIRPVHSRGSARRP